MDSPLFMESVVPEVSNNLKPISHFFLKNKIEWQPGKKLKKRATFCKNLDFSGADDAQIRLALLLLLLLCHRRVGNSVDRELISLIRVRSYFWHSCRHYLFSPPFSHYSLILTRCQKYERTLTLIDYLIIFIPDHSNLGDMFDVGGEGAQHIGVQQDQLPCSPHSHPRLHLHHGLPLHAAFDHAR